MSAAFNLAGLLRLRRLEEDQRAAELGTARDGEAIGAARTRRVRNALSDSSTDPLSHASLASIAASRASTAELLSELDDVDRVAADRVERAAAEHAAAHRRTLGLEKLEERFEERQKAEELRAEQLLLDDLAARAWRLTRPEEAPE